MYHSCRRGKWSGRKHYIQSVIADHKALRDEHHAALTQIIEKQNETAMKLAVCIDRNSEALKDCAFELRRFQEGVSRTAR